MEKAKDNHSYKLAIWIIFSGALLIRLAAVAMSSLYPPVQRLVLWGDAGVYAQLAQNLLLDGTFHFSGGSATAFRMPGYPFFLALTFATLQTPIVAQLIHVAADLLVMFCTLRMAEYLFKSSLVSLLAIVILALHPILILSNVTLYAESLGLLSTTLALLVLLRSENRLSSGWLAGIALSVGIYMKTNLLLVAMFMVFVAGCKWFSLQGIRGFVKAVFPPMLVIVLAMLPWVWRNWVVMDAFIPTTTSNGVNMYRGNNPLADGGAASDQPYVLPGMSEVESSAEFSRQAWEWIRANPGTFIRLLPAKAWHFVWPLALSASGTIQANALLTGVLFLITLVFYLLAAAGTWVCFRQSLVWEVLLILSPFIALLGLSLLSYGGIRFSLPALPGLAILTSAGLVLVLYRRLPNRSERVPGTGAFPTVSPQ